MDDSQSNPVRCADCAFWRHVKESDGTCRRHAPDCAARSEEVAHWPQTRGYQGCGEGAPAAPAAPGLTCGNCVYWHRPAGGLAPFDRGDMPKSWWDRAGFCVRHAPKPLSEPGARAFWRATHDAEFCAEGHPRKRDATDT